MLNVRRVSSSPLANSTTVTLRAAALFGFASDAPEHCTAGAAEPKNAKSCVSQMPAHKTYATRTNGQRFQLAHALQQERRQLQYPRAPLRAPP
jgi:hypothetical protein